MCSVARGGEVDAYGFLENLCASTPEQLKIGLFGPDASSALLQNRLLAKSPEKNLWPFRSS